MSSSIDTMAFHAALIFLACGLAYLVLKLVKGIPVLSDISVWAYGMIIMFLIWGIMCKLKINYLVDSKVKSKISSSFTEFAVIAAIASLPIKAVATYLCYLHTHRKNFAVPGADEIAVQLHMSVDMAMEQLDQLNHRGLINENGVPMFKNASKYFFSLPNELFFLNTGHGAITVYAYLLYCEDRRTHQCHPSYRTISEAVHLTVATVMKHITKLVDRKFITVENTTYVDRQGMKRNGNNLYTILPIQAAMDHCYQQQMLRLEERTLMQQQCKNPLRSPL